MLRLFLLLILLVVEVRGACYRVPQGASGDRSPVDDNFKILIDGNPATYVPEHQYNGERFKGSITSYFYIYGHL